MVVIKVKVDELAVMSFVASYNYDGFTLRDARYCVAQCEIVMTLQCNQRASDARTFSRF
jgi:hypothetical protein